VNPVVASTWKGPEILAQVPADTPYLFGVIEPIPAAVREQMAAQGGTQLIEMLKKAASGDGKLALIAAAMYQELDGVDPAHWLEAIGLADNGRIVVYGMSLWPVLRMEAKDPARVREVLGRVIHAVDPELQPQTVGPAQLYKVKSGGLAAVFGTVDREVVAALLPTEELDRVMPALVGTERPAHSLRDAKLLPELLAKHRFLPQVIAFADTLRVIEAVSGRGKGQFDDLEARLRGKLPNACQADLVRIGTVLQRFVIGYRRIDEHGFAVTMAVETPASVVKALAKLHTPMPAMPIGGQPLFAIGAAVNLDAAIGWMKDTTSALRAAPFRCAWFAESNHAVDDLAAKLDKPVLPMFQGLRGFELVIDDATMLPPAGTGHLLLAGDHMADLVHQMLAQVPQLAGLQLPADGEALELPLAKLGLPESLKSLHFALRQTRAAIAVGDNSAARASERTAAPDGRAPLLMFSYDLPKLRERFKMFMKDADLGGLSTIASTSLAFDVGDDGIYVDMVGIWAHGNR
jgi:hypothetical protein